MPAKLHHSIADGRVASNQLLALTGARRAELRISDTPISTSQLILGTLWDRGDKVYPVEVERLRGSHPSVVEAAVVGVSDTHFAQRLYAFVVPKPGVSSDELPDELRSYVRDNLAWHKVPRSVEIVAELPQKRPANRQEGAGYSSRRWHR